MSKILCIQGAAWQRGCRRQDIRVEAGSRVRGSGKDMDQTKGVVDQGKDAGLYAVDTGRARHVWIRKPRSSFHAARED